MKKRGYKHRRTDDQFIVSGQYVRNLQYVYSKETETRDGLIVDLVYFAADMLDEKLVIGFYRENTDIENGICANVSRSLGLTNISKRTVEVELDRLIPPLRENI
jgi:hypothetical protein